MNIEDGLDPLANVLDELESNCCAPLNMSALSPLTTVVYGWLAGVDCVSVLAWPLLSVIAET
jgi:hypothetical protein